MTERECFMKAIRDNPDDDTARLAYADWLQEQGEEERAEFIRVQVALAALVFDPSNWALLGDTPEELHRNIGCDCYSCEAAKPLWVRQDELLLTYSNWGRIACPGCGAVRWRFETDGGIRSIEECSTCDGTGDLLRRGGREPAVWSRGFVNAVTLPVVDWIIHGDAILALHPVRLVTITHVDHNLDAFVLIGENNEYPWLSDRWIMTEFRLVAGPT